MARMDRREKLALNDAYRFFKAVMKEHRPPDLFQLANSLKTVSYALKFSETGQFKLTTRLWRHIQESLFDKLITSFPSHVVVYLPGDEALCVKEPIPEQASIEIHPEGLKRTDDFFRMEVKSLHPITQLRLKKVWRERGPSIKPEDFVASECGEMCAPKIFIIGAEILENESEFGKQNAHQKWWELYWQAYCTNDKQEKQTLEREMAVLEAVWGNLYY